MWIRKTIGLLPRSTPHRFSQWKYQVLDGYGLWSIEKNIKKWFSINYGALSRSDPSISYIAYSYT